MWLGLGIGFFAVLLFALAGMLRRRGAGAAPRTPEQALPGATSRKPAKPPRTTAASSSQDDDMADIEAILKKHGIT